MMPQISIPSRIKKPSETVAPRKSFADTKRWLSNEFYQQLNRHTTTKDGDMVTNAQAMISGIIRMAVDPEKDDYVRLAASKFIIEHMEGKSSAMHDEQKVEMPKVVINVNGGNLNVETVKDNLSAFEGSEPEEDVVDEIVEYEVTDE